MRHILRDGDTIITAYAQPAHGPGCGGNKLLLVIVMDRDDVLRRECLQPEEQSGDVQLLYDTAAAMHDELLRAVERQLREGRK